MDGLSRRRVLATSAGAGAALAAGAAGWAPVTARAATPLKKDPFTLGVASGDPATDSVILWTRLAPQPLDDSGRGGMPVVAHEVEWEIARDERFAAVVNRGTAVAQPTFGHAVHVEATGLRPGREYFYRFRTGGWTSRTARTRTLPAPGEMPSSLAMSFASCAMWEHGYFSAYADLAASDPDLVLFLGDYTYEYAPGAYKVSGGPVREHVGPVERTIGNYRQRYAQYRTDQDLQAAHAAAPWLVVFDDHEVEDNWAGMHPGDSDDDPAKFRQMRAAAFRAYYENMPLRRSSLPGGPFMSLYRRFGWGDLATFHMLDTRQYRDDQPCHDGVKWCPSARDADRTIMGRAQEKWLYDGFGSSRARWDVVGQQVFFAKLGLDPVKGDLINADGWDGYAANRQRLTDAFTRSDARNLLVVSGDIHCSWANEIRKDFAHPEPTARDGANNAGVELISTSISSGGNGFDLPLNWPLNQWNPHIKYGNYLRGYTRTRITPESVQAEFRCLPKVSVRGEEAFTRASFVVPDREPRLVPVKDFDARATQLGAERRNPDRAESIEIAQHKPGHTS